MYTVFKVDFRFCQDRIRDESVFFLSFFLPKICKRNNQTGRKESASAALIRMSGHVCVCAQGVRVRGASMEAPAHPCDEAAAKVRTHAAR